MAQLQAVCSVCARDPDKGAAFLGLVQAGLGSTGDERRQSMALRCVRELCAADVLEFYGAWRAVVACLPSLPDADSTAAEWVGLGRGGVTAMKESMRSKVCSWVVLGLMLLAGALPQGMRDRGAV